jgi:hypothetical protein
MKTNREKNQEYDARQGNKVRPKDPKWDFKPLEDVIRQWVTKNESTTTIW